jgi:hypothetical protein
MVTEARAFFSSAPWFSDPAKVVFKEKKVVLVYLQSIRGDRKIYVLVHKYPW